MDGTSLHEDRMWGYVLSLLPADLEQSARRDGAMERGRGVPDARSLVRLVLAYALSGLSMKDVAAWAAAGKVAEISGPGLFYRLREAEKWLGNLLAATLQEEVPRAGCGLRLTVVDATVVNGPGARGTRWRAHARIDPCTGTLCSVKLTGAEGGEGYGHHPVEAGEVVLGDRAYATARGLHKVRQAGAHVVARINPHTLRVCGAGREVLKLRRMEGNVPVAGAIEFDILVPIPPVRTTRSHRSWLLERASDWVGARAVAGRTRGGEVIWVLTTLPRELAGPGVILDLYRIRWQVEMLFKRLKSQIHLDTLPSRQGPTARTWMLARLLAAALCQQMTRPAGPLSPWGYRIGACAPAHSNP